jgi:hypothetical protein
MSSARRWSLSCNGDDENDEKGISQDLVLAIVVTFDNHHSEQQHLLASVSVHFPNSALKKAYENAFVCRIQT